MNVRIQLIIFLLILSPVVTFANVVCAQEFKTNATIQTTSATPVKVLYDKPKYRGWLGITSLLTNTLSIRFKGYSLENGTRIRLIESFKTGLRGYHYVKFRYQREGEIRTGWAWAGKSPNDWLDIIPDNLSDPYHSNNYLSNSVKLAINSNGLSIISSAWAQSEQETKIVELDLTKKEKNTLRLIIILSLIGLATVAVYVYKLTKWFSKKMAIIPLQSNLVSSIVSSIITVILGKIIDVILRLVI